MSSIIKHGWHIFALGTRANILTSVQDFFVFQQPIKKMSPQPYAPAKKSEKGYGDENAKQFA